MSCDDSCWSSPPATPSTASTSIVVETARQNLINIDPVTQSLTTDYYTNATQAAVIGSRALAAQAVDALDLHNPRGGVWTYWDYQAGAWQRDHGFRIDHALLSPEMADRLTSAGVDKEHRGREKASDHAPVWFEFTD